jgi:hypothetical protein
MNESTRAVTHDCVQKYTPKYIYTLLSSMARVCMCVWVKMEIFVLAKVSSVYHITTTSKGVLLSPNDVTKNISHKIASFIFLHKNS